MQHKIIWPDRRLVDADTLLMWGQDAYFNHADHYICDTCGQDTRSLDDCLHEADCTPVWTDGTQRPTNDIEARELLDDLGVVTFGRAA